MSKHWRCGGSLYYVSQVALIFKDTKAHCFFSGLTLFLCRKPLMSGNQKTENLFVRFYISNAMLPAIICSFVISFQIFGRNIVCQPNPIVGNEEQKIVMIHLF